MSFVSTICVTGSFRRDTLQEKKETHLLRAVDNLALGIEQLSIIEKEVFGIETPILPHSVRFFSGRVSVEIERDIGVFRGNLSADFNLQWDAWIENTSDLFPSVDNKMLEKLKALNGVSDSKEKYDVLASIAEDVFLDALHVCRNVQKEKFPRHTSHMWEYICLRSAQTCDFVELVDFIFHSASARKFADYKNFSHIRFPELIEMQKRFNSYASIGPMKGTREVNGLSRNWGMMAAVKFYYEICKKLAQDPTYLPDTSPASSWQKLQYSCSCLVQTGIPRFVVNELKEKLLLEISDRTKISF